SSSCRWWRDLSLRSFWGSRYEEAVWWRATRTALGRDGALRLRSGQAPPRHHTSLADRVDLLSGAGSCLRRAGRWICGALFVLGYLCCFSLFVLCADDLAVPAVVPFYSAAKRLRKGDV